MGVKGVFYSHIVGLMGEYDFFQTVSDQIDLLMEMEPAGRLYGPVGEDGIAVPVIFDDPIPCGLDARIYTKDLHALIFAIRVLRKDRHIKIASIRIDSDFLLVDIEIGPHILDIVVVLQLIHQAEKLLGGFARQFYIILGNLSQIFDVYLDFMLF